MIHSLVLLLISGVLIEGSHFNGGTITWQPVYPSSNSSKVPIIITQSYFWTSSIIVCSTNVPKTSSSPQNNVVNLTCVSGCSTDGGYSLLPIDILTDCQTINTLVDIMSSQRSVGINLTAGAYFRIAYIDDRWIALNYPVISGLPWSLVCFIDLRLRPDGFINTSPIASVVSPQYAIVNRTTQISIPVSDVNTGDTVRCRWATNNQTFDECAGVCYPNSVPNGTFLSGCTIHFIGYVVNTWYGIAIQVEDFINNTSLIPMSSIPVQFLVNVIDPPACGLAPLIVPPSISFNVQVGVPISFNISAVTRCNPNISDIDSIRVTASITGMTISNTTDSATNSSVSFATFRWTPQPNQVGSQQQLCVIAYSDEKLQSDQYCMIFDVMTTTSTSSSTTSTTTTSTSTTSTSSSSMLTSTTTMINTVMSSSTPTEEVHSSLLFITLVTILAVLFLTVLCCCLYWLCCKSVVQHNGQSQKEELIDSLRHESTRVKSIQRNRYWIPMFAVGLFRTKLVHMNVVRPVEPPSVISISHNGLPRNQGQPMPMFRHI